MTFKMWIISLFYLIFQPPQLKNMVIHNIMKYSFHYQGRKRPHISVPQSYFICYLDSFNDNEIKVRNLQITIKKCSYQSITGRIQNKEKHYEWMT